MADQQTTEVQIDDIPCLSGDIVVPLAWAWTADVTARADVADFAVGQVVTLTINGISRSGAVASVGKPDLLYVLRIVGGAGKLGTLLEATDYQGRGLDEVVGDVLKAAGETAGDLSALQSVSLQHWLRGAETAQRALHRLMRMAPAGVVLRVGRDGKWTAVKPDWTQVGEELRPLRVESYPAEDSVLLHALPDLDVEPGTSVLLLDEAKRVDRVQYRWGGAQFTVELWFGSGDDQLGRLREAIRTIVLDCLAEYRGPDYGRLYAGKVSKDGGDNGKVDVTFEDSFGRVKSVSQATVRREVGDTVKWKKDTRVLVGWEFGDESKPFAISASWAGNGGLIDKKTTAGNATVELDGNSDDVIVNGGTKKVARVSAGDKVEKHGHTVSEFAGQFSLTAGPYTVIGTIATANDSHDELEITVGGADHFKSA